MRWLAVTELDVAARLLADGQLVGVPTDTVYGLAASLHHEAAVGSLFVAKRRPTDVPVAVLCATVGEARSLAADWGDAARRLAQRFWPGPLTMVVPCADELAMRVRADRGVGVRVPDDATCLALLTRTGPLAVTSANPHGQPPATTADDVATAFGDGTVAAVVDDGVRDGEVSTVVDLTGSSVVVVREGAVPAGEIRAAISGA